MYGATEAKQSKSAFNHQNKNTPHCVAALHKEARPTVGFSFKDSGCLYLLFHQSVLITIDIYFNIASILKLSP